MLISTFFIIINKKNFKSPASATTLGGGVHMNDLAKILGIDDANSYSRQKTFIQKSNNTVINKTGAIN